MPRTWDGIERRTLIRKTADPTQAGVLRGEVSPFMGEVVEVACRYCGNRETVVMGDEVQACWCQLD